MYLYDRKESGSVDDESWGRLRGESVVGVAVFVYEFNRT
jgi:hypothetical protein